MAAWMEGAGACRGGIKREENPYPPTSDKGTEWFRGWDLVQVRSMIPLHEQVVVRPHHRTGHART